MSVSSTLSGSIDKLPPATAHKDANTAYTVLVNSDEAAI
jgi:hypothetical protein